MNLPGLQETVLARIIQAVRDLAEGASNAIGRPDLVLDPGTETAVASRLCVPGALVVAVPLDADAAAAGVYLKSTSRGSFVLGHAAGAEERRVRFEIRRP